MNKSRLHELLLVIARGQRWMAGAVDLFAAMADELADVGAAVFYEVRMIFGGVGSTITYMTGAEMDQTVQGRRVGDAVGIVVGPATDAHGHELSQGADFAFEVTDPNVLGLEIDPADITVDEGQRGCRVTILGDADADLLITLNRPTAGPLSSTVHFTGTVPESIDDAVDFNVEILPDAEPAPPEPPPPPVARPGGRTPPKRGGF